MNFLKEFFHIRVDINKSRDTGLAMVLILVLLELFLESRIYLKIAVVVLVLNMITPQIFYPIAYIWFGFAHLLGTFVSRILLFLVYATLVFPVGLIRRMLGKDSLQLKKWKQNSSSVFKTRNHLYIHTDIEKPY